MTGPLVRKLICATTAAGSIAVTAYLANLWLNAPTLNSIVPPPPSIPVPQPPEEEKHASPMDTAEEGNGDESAEQEDAESEKQKNNDDSSKSKDASEEDVPPPPPEPPAESGSDVHNSDPAQDKARLKDYIVYKLGEITRNHRYWKSHRTFLLTNWKLYYLDPLLKSIKQYKQSINDAAQNTSNPPGTGQVSPGSPSSNGGESDG